MSLSIGLALGAVLTLAGASAAAFFVRRRKDPAGKEMRRREFVLANGRMIEGYVTGFEQDLIHYSYRWRSVQYDASQDVSDLLQNGAPAADLAGPVTVRFLASQPSNSIVMADGWSGIPNVVPVSAPKRPTPSGVSL